jgi:hypothetical protein
LLITNLTCPQKISLQGNYDITNLNLEGLALYGELAESDDQVDITAVNGIKVTYNFTTSFSDIVIAGTTYKDASEGWENSTKFQ